MIAAAVLGIVAVGLALMASRWVQRGGEAQEISADPAQVEREVYERLYGKPSAEVSPALPVDRSPEGQGEIHRASRTRADSKDRRGGRGAGVRGSAVHAGAQRS